MIFDSNADSSITADSDDVFDVRIGGTDAFFWGHGTGNTGAFIHIDPGAFSATSGTNIGLLRIGNTAAATTTGTTAIAAGVLIETPNWTVGGGSITNTATLYVEGAASEGGTDYALWVDDGAVKFDGTLEVTGATTQTGALSIDDTTDSTSGTTGSGHTDGGFGAVKDIFTDATLNAAGDTAAGDNAAIGYTATEGLILTGQGSTDDITLKNDADTAVLQVATGGTVVDIPGSLTIADKGVKAVILTAEQASTSGNDIDFTGIPAGVQRISVMLNQVSTDGTDPIYILLGDAGGFEESGYLSVAGSPSAATAGTAGFVINTVSIAAQNYQGVVVFHLQDSTGFSWCMNGNIAKQGGGTDQFASAGSKSLSAELTQIRVTTSGGTDAFDDGVMSVQYE